MIHRHGGDIYEYDREMLDFSANINPLGVPSSVREAIIKSAYEIEKYPDPYCRKLRSLISEREEIDSKNIICGNGAAELIFNLTYSLRPKKALIAAPAFAEYSRAAAASGAEIVYSVASAEKGYIHGTELTDKIDEDTEIVFICNPSNPTGAVMRRDTIEAVVSKAEAAGAVTVVDECFLDFLKAHCERSCVRLTEKYKNLVVLKSFTKMYAIPGIRLGYMICSDPVLMEKMYVSRQPWSVSTSAQEAGKAACIDTEHAERTRVYIASERDYIKQSFDRLRIRYEEPNANYIFFYHKPELKAELIKRGILIRDCSDYEGLNKGCYRAAIRTHSENEILIKNLSELLSKDGKVTGG